MADGRIIALGGGGFSMEPENHRLDDFILSTRGRSRPKVCFIATASGDADSYLLRFYQAFAGRAIASHVGLFKRSGGDLQVLLDQDIIYVGGGNTANLLALWKLHGLDQILRDCWEAGVVLCGISAGALCWFEGGVTDSFGPELTPLAGALGLIPGSFCPHYGDAARRAAYHQAIEKGMPAGFAAEDGVALQFEGVELARIVSSRPGARAYRITRTEHGTIEEAAIPAELLP